MLIISTFSLTTRKSIFQLVRHTPRAFASRNHKARIEDHVITKIRRFLRLELRLQHIEGYIHECLDQALLSTPCHQQVFGAVIVYLIRYMWPQPAASVYDRMSNQGYISSDVVDAKMLVVLLADTQGSADTVLGRLSDILLNPDFSDQHFLALLSIAEDYNVRPKYIITLIQTFLRGKGTKYTPRRGIIATWLRAAVKLGDVELMRDILELGDATLKVAAMVEAWEVADKLDDCLEKLGIRLVGAVADPATKEDDFLRALEVIKEVGMNEHIVARVCASFLANRDANYRPKTETVRAAIEAFIKVDKVDEAFALLCRVGIQPGIRPVHQTFLANLRDSRPLDHQSFAKLLSAMDAAGVSLDTSLLNILISREVRLKRAANALVLYNEMKKNPQLSPDSYTFGSLFSMYRRIRPSSMRKFSGTKSLGTPTYPLRALFQELLQSSKRGENPVLPNTALLNTALRAFMRQRDYAGAIIIIRYFGLFRVPLDNKSYYYVVKLLVRRVWAEVQGSRPKNEERWVDRFLGVQHYGDIVLNESLVYEIFTALCKKKFDVSLPLHLPHQGRRHRLLRHLRKGPVDEAYYPFPTMQMMESDPVPLVRLLSRALYADAIVHPGEASWKVDELIKKAEDDMITTHSASAH
jgi:hypothetical protein